MAKAIIHHPEPESEIRLPPPVPDGTQYVESLGFVDRLVGVMRDRRKAEAELAPLTMSADEWAAGGDEAEPIEPPPPVSGGDDVGTRGGKPGDYGTK